ncbi:anaerobic ribonucleoside-triphosphate reductase activating protein [Desulfallas thermosapovorans]|uniref:Anaerobic ribonucleoside-triphosphate reductase-activating protein n=1 Tax=Desulfallas thermosapovorans DSM 6562 TaxID=1121431 RepID=A0A5S4ZSH2_9FIRM|nr:anaerobic ribonucleoside-triphosphate reductase activating protein [Desulfallas thermosapovorans]TYO95889.1 anaerobic ribonucleoside-triphosphate reductase activating protein [Desulfallas thermosapovorans DSM 6562]
MHTIRISGIIKESVVDGPGFRLVIFTQGCPRHCPGCHNPDLIPARGGREMTPDEVLQLIRQNITPLTGGITFSGGDPLMQARALAEILQLLRKEYPLLSIWVYTGYVFEEIKDWPVLRYIDVLVDGPYEESKRDISLAFRGSSNQRLIDVPASLNGEVQCLAVP